MRLTGRRIWFGVLALVILTALSAPSLAAAVTQHRDRAPRTLWKTYPLNPGGDSRITKQQPALHGDRAIAPKTEQNPTTSLARGGAANFAPPRDSSGSDHLLLIAGISVAALALILLTRPALRAGRGTAGALEAGAILLYASVIFVSVLVGMFVVLLVRTMVGS
jgi:hypothetical protein